jgi:hypothetical protein
MKNIELNRSNCFKNKIIIVDGQGRSGKNLIAVLLSTMKHVEKLRLDGQFDYLPRYFSLGKMSEDAFITALRIEADEKLFNTMISRDVNFRLSDYSGVFKQGKRLEYFKRLFMMSDDQAVKILKKGEVILQEMTHDALQFANLFFNAFDDRLKMIHIFRDPIGNIFEQDKRDFGVRIGADPREFQLTFEYNNQLIPLMALGMEEDYLSANSTERLIMMVNSMFRKNLLGYLNLNEDQKKNVLFIEFEDFVVNPDKYYTDLEKFVGNDFGVAKKRILKRENCPRIIDPKERVERLAAINSRISSKYKIILEELIYDYDKKDYLKF